MKAVCNRGSAVRRERRVRGVRCKYKQLQAKVVQSNDKGGQPMFPRGGHRHHGVVMKVVDGPCRKRNMSDDLQLWQHSLEQPKTEKRCICD